MRMILRKLRLMLVSLCAFCATASDAQESDSLVIWGWPKDAFTMEPVVDSTLAEIMTLDSTVIATARPFWNKQYRPNSFFNIPLGVRSGEYIIRLTNPEYQTTMKRFKLKVGKKEDSFNLGVVKLRRKPLVRERALGEATVTATKIKFYTKDDTLVYNADAFNLAEGSMLDALVEQLPGVELKRDGRILLNGKQVESVLLNGKDFFKGDNTVLLDNLPAYTVKTIKFYDQTSERSKALGVDLNDSRFVMDVNLKREYQVGWLANAEAGGGTHERWLGRLFALRFTPQSRLSFFANANNTHESRKPGRNGEWSPSDIGNGTSTTRTVGLDYMVDDKNTRFQVEGNASVAYTDNNTLTRQQREMYQNSGSVFGRSLQTEKSQSTSVNTNHNIRLMLGPENDKYQTQLYLKPQFSYSRSENAMDRIAAEFSANPIGEGDWETLFGGPTAGNALTNLLVNKVRTRQAGNSENYNGGFNSQFYFRMPLTGRRMELNTSLNAGRSTAHSFDLYTLTYAGAGQDDTRHRYYNKPSNHLDASASLTWAYLLYKKGFHSFGLTPSIGYDYAHTKKENSLYRLDWLEEMANADFGTLPSTREALLSSLDRPNSYLTTSNSHTGHVSTMFNYEYDVREYRDGDRVRTALWRVRVAPGIDWRQETLHFDGQQQTSRSRTELTPALMLRLERNTPGMMHQIWLEGSYRQQLPSLFSLLGMRFDSDPLNISEGNTDLHRTEIFSTYLYYTSDKWGNAQQRRMSGKMTATFYRNAFATAQVYDAQTGVRTYRPQNVNGNYVLNFTGTFVTPIDAKKRLMLNVSLNDDFYRNVDLQSTNAPTPQRSTVYTNYLSLPLSVEYGYNKLRVGTKYKMAWHSARSERENFQNINGINMEAGIYGNMRLPWNMQVATDFTFYARRGYDNAVMNTDNFVWNAQLSKSIMHGNLVFALVAYDILGDTSNLRYSVNMQGVTETWRNVIPRYGMLRVIYKLNKQPKKKH